MKNLLSLLFLTTSVIVTSCSKPDVPEGTFLIRGHLKNVADSSVVSLYEPAGGGASREIARDTIINGYFEFADSISDVKEPYTIMSHSEGFTFGWLNIWVESKLYVEINGNSGALQSWEVTSDNPIQKEEANYMRYVLPVTEKGFGLSKEQNKYTAIMLEKMRANEDYRTVYPKLDSLDRLYAPIRKDIEFKKLEYLENTPVSEHWMLTYYTYARFLKYFKEKDKVAKIKEIYTLIPDDYLNTPQGKDITSFIYPEKTVEIGDKLPEITFYDLDNKKRSLSELKGKYILLDIWSQGCGPCIASIPELKEISKMYKDELCVVSVNMDGEKAWRDIVKTYELEGYQWNEKVKTSRLDTILDMPGIPAYALINPEGVVESKWTGYGKGSLKDRLKSLMK